MLLKKNNNATKCIVFLKQNNSEDFIGALYTSLFFSWKVDFLSFKKSPNINLYAEYSRT